jgi:hypothetical protein
MHDPIMIQTHILGSKLTESEHQRDGSGLRCTSVYRRIQLRQGVKLSHFYMPPVGLMTRMCRESACCQGSEASLKRHRTTIVLRE